MSLSAFGPLVQTDVGSRYYSAVPVLELRDLRGRRKIGTSSTRPFVVLFLSWACSSAYVVRKREIERGGASHTDFVIRITGAVWN